MKIKTIEIGTIQLPNKVIISDPCYKTESECNKTVSDMKPGKYHIFLRKSDEKEWGKRVSRLMAIHEDYYNKISWEFASPDSVYDVFPLTTEHHLVGVDSGCMGIYGYEYFANNVHNEDWYFQVCGLTNIANGRGGIQDNICAISESGYGDGGYDACIVYDKQDAVAIIIDFGVEENEEDEEEY